MSTPIIPINAGSDLSQIVAMINQNFAQIGGASVITLYNDSTGTPNISVGLQKDGTSRILSALPGVDVTKATPGQLAFDSSRAFTVGIQSSHTFSPSGSVADGGKADYGTIAIAHGIGNGFTPDVNCFAPTTVGGYSFSTAPTGFPLGAVSLVPNGWVIQQADGAFFNFYYAVDTTDLYIGMVFFNSTGGTLTPLPVTVYYTVFTLNSATN